MKDVRVFPSYIFGAEFRPIPNGFEAVFPPKCYLKFPTRKCPAPKKFQKNKKKKHHHVLIIVQNLFLQYYY